MGAQVTGRHDPAAVDLGKGAQIIETPAAAANQADADRHDLMTRPLLRLLLGHGLARRWACRGSKVGPLYAHAPANKRTRAAPRPGGRTRRGGADRPPQPGWLDHVRLQPGLRGRFRRLLRLHADRAACRLRPSVRRRRPAPGMARPWASPLVSGRLPATARLCGRTVRPPAVSRRLRDLERAARHRGAGHLAAARSRLAVAAEHAARDRAGPSPGRLLPAARPGGDAVGRRARAGLVVLAAWL